MKPRDETTQAALQRAKSPWPVGWTGFFVTLRAIISLPGPPLCYRSRPRMRASCLSVLVASSNWLASGFLPPSLSVRLQNASPAMEGSVTTLGMAKKMRNKQLELVKKMAMAKEQNLKQDGTMDDSKAVDRLSDRELKEQNDRRRFEEMLQKQTASLNFVSSDGYLSREQEEAEIDAYRKSDLCGWIWSIRWLHGELMST
jgi:hypothetical protein